MLVGYPATNLRAPNGLRRTIRDFLPQVKQALKGKYEVEREFARGGAARVFMARNADGEPVALKVLHPQLAVSVTAERFLREIGFLSKMQHPRIGKLIDYGESEYLVYYVMEFIAGPTLREQLTRNGRAEAQDAVRMARDLLSALQYAHDLGIVHRDVKPENIVLAEHGAVLLDFGIARAVAESGSDRLTRSGFAVGTSAYMSPEQVEGSHDLDHRSDIYSLGCVLFEALTGYPPYSSGHEEVVLRMHLDDEVPDVRAVREEVPQVLASLIFRAMERERDQRWQSASAMSKALEAVDLA